MIDYDRIAQAYEYEARAQYCFVEDCVQTARHIVGDNPLCCYHYSEETGEECDCYDDDYADAAAESAQETYNGKTPADFAPARHPLAPPALTERDAIAIMERAANGAGRHWFCLFDGAYIVCEEADLMIYWPDAPIIARSHCGGCGDRMVNPLSDRCAACSEYEGQHADEAIRAEPILYINDLPQIAA